MKVLLIYPAPPKKYWPRGSFRSHWLPSGLSALAGVLLRAGHDVRVHIREEQLARNGFDWSATDAQTRQLIQDYQPEMVGFSMVSPAVAETAWLSQMVKDMLGSHVITVAGGPHPTAIPEQTLTDCPALDAVAIGEADETILDLANLGLCQTTPGLVVRCDDKFVTTPPRQAIADLDSLPAVPYQLFGMDYYTQPSRWLIRWINLSVANIRTSRGCTNRCRFCAGHLVSGVGVRFRSIESVLDQIQYVVSKFAVQGIHFEDDTVGANAERLMGLCDGLSRRGLNKKIVWDCCLRVDQAQLPLLRAMKQAGCIQIEYGFESGSDESLARLGKGVTVDMNRRAVELTRQAGLRVFADIMVGLPGETSRDFKATVDFLRFARPDVISTGQLCPLPGTPIFDALSDAIRKGIDWGGYSYLDKPPCDINLSAMSDAEFATLYRRFQKYIVQPATTWAFLKDTQPENRKDRLALRKTLLRFILKHPLRSLAVPWRKG
jgi:anaerobic magnesium-protoporphyrin IX monomethyl ester cyclase